MSPGGVRAHVQPVADCGAGGARTQERSALPLGKPMGCLGAPGLQDREEAYATRTVATRGSKKRAASASTDGRRKPQDPSRAVE